MNKNQNYKNNCYHKRKIHFTLYILVRLLPSNYEFFTRFEKRFQDAMDEDTLLNTNYDQKA